MNCPTARQLLAWASLLNIFIIVLAESALSYLTFTLSGPWWPEYSLMMTEWLAPFLEGNIF
jgi:hypothetical protein